jgi:molybdate transport system substrate-binding protein
MRRRLVLGAGAALAVGARAPVLAQSPIVRVAVAADMRFAMEQIGQEFTRKYGVAVSVTSGASGSLVRQIAQGAPFHLFLSADEASVKQLAERDLTLGGQSDTGRIYALGYVALVWPKTSTVTASVQERLLGARKIAIANPEHAPYGRAALAVLQTLGLQAQLRDRFVYGENVAQAAQFVATGAADLGLVAVSIAKAPAVQASLAHEVVNPQSTGTLVQRMVILKNAQDPRVLVPAQQLYAFLQSAPARDVLRHNGFGLTAQVMGS